MYKRCLKSANILLSSFGINVYKLVLALRGYPRYFRNLRKLKLSIQSSGPYSVAGSVVGFGMPFPVVDEFWSSAGTASGHYFHQDLYVANQIYRARPGLHLDVGSRIDGFIAHLLSFEQKILLGDIRPIEIQNSNISFLRLDLASKLDPVFNCRYESISCLHAIEHMGLGRYGDLVNAMGHYSALENLSELLSETGVLYLSYPVGVESRIEYNAHRVISLSESRDMFELYGLVVKGFAYIDDKGFLNRVDDLSTIDWSSSYNLNYGCAVWTLQKC